MAFARQVEEQAEEDDDDEDAREEKIFRGNSHSLLPIALLNFLKLLDLVFKVPAVLLLGQSQIFVVISLMVSSCWFIGSILFADDYLLKIVSQS